MHNKILNKLKENKAFTLMETLIVLGIFCILVGISVSSVIQTQSSSNSVELDSYARKIFMEAQDKFQAMRAESSLGSLNGSDVTQKPADFDGDYDGDNSDNSVTLHYIHKSEAAAFGIASIKDGDDYVIEYNPATGEVYAVFYWLNGSPNYSQVDSSENNYRSSKNNRAAAKVGYYGGGSIDTEKVDPLEVLNVDLVNSEELYLKITFGDITPANMKIQCVIKEQSANDSITCNITGYNSDSAIPVSWKSLGTGQWECALLLDSMQSGKDFSTLTGGRLTPGEDLHIDVKSIYNNKESYNEVEGNSLFADGTKKEEDGSVVIEINTLRHLRNLGAPYYSNNANKVTIKQTGDIDFNNNNYAWNYSGSTASYAGVRGATRPDSVSSGFNSISNDTLFGKVNWRTEEEETLVWKKVGWDSAAGTNIDKVTVDGNGNRLQNFVINGSGIFEAAVKTDFKNIRIEDIKVMGTSKATGALVGFISDGTINDCGVYLTTYQGNGATKAYYAFEVNDGVNQMKKRYEEFRILGLDGSDNVVGGLIGLADNATITGSYAAVMVDKKESTNIRGGLIGRAVDCENISSCYASGDIANNQVIAGGLIGIAQNTKVTDSYSTSDVGESPIENGTAGGFVGWSNGSEYERCVAYGEVPHREENFFCGGFVGKDEVSRRFFDCSYLKQIGYNSGHANSPVAAASYSSLVSSGGNLALGASYPYDSSLYENEKLRTDFPFKAVTGTHYGNWPTEQNIDVPILVYYEKYAGEKYGLYAETELPTAANTSVDWIINTLKNEECFEDGYALLSKYNLEKFSYKFNDLGTFTTLSVDGTNVVKVAAPEGTSFNDINGVNNSEQLYFYKLPYDLQLPENAGRTRFYDKLTIKEVCAKGSTTPILAKEVDFYYCPYFAKTAVNPNSLTGADNISTTQPTVNPATVSIRSARQVYALGRNRYFWDIKDSVNQSVNFVQESNINFETYENTYVPIGDTAKAFSCNYDGQKLYLKNVKHTMFGANAGRIENCYVENIQISKPGETVAGFVLTNESAGTITNCRIYGGTQGETADSRYGKAIIEGNEAYGFVAVNEGTISKAFITGTVNGLYVTQPEKGAKAAGFVGENTGTISHSYANCRVSVTGKEENTGTVTGYASGFVYASNGAAGSISKCYSVGNVVSKTLSDTYIYLYGFASKETGMEYCYSISDIAYTSKSFAFADEWTSENECYWGYDKGSELNIHFDIENDNSISLTSLETLKEPEYYGSSSEKDVSFIMGEGVGLYPYPSVEVPHYGDWPEIGIVQDSEGQEEATLPSAPPSDNGTKKEYQMGIFYYEEYSDGQYGIYAVGSTMENSFKNVTFSNDSTKNTGDRDALKLINTLKTGTPERSGYGIYYCDTFGALDRVTILNENNMYVSIKEIDGAILSTGADGYIFRVLEPVNENTYTKKISVKNGAIFANTYILDKDLIVPRNN